MFEAADTADRFITAEPLMSQIVCRARVSDNTEGEITFNWCRLRLAIFMAAPSDDFGHNADIEGKTVCGHHQAV